MSATTWKQREARASRLRTLLARLDDTSHLTEVVDLLDQLYPVLEERYHEDRDPTGEHEGIDTTVPTLASRGRVLLAEQPMLLQHVIDARQQLAQCRDALARVAAEIRTHEEAELTLRLDSAYFETGGGD